ncbi:hypothetical protein N1851_007967 [Merluccius polli]|uniref:Uncharacterized protein n=1 Tax=Merluccius polli TaxID=89951 RepID=A0AA47N2B4_MERPO|nr:hypothetical protein N1851_007967 [Merluccius polli]
MIRRYIKSQLQGRTGTCFRRTGTKALVLSRLDYCNSLLAGLPASAIKPLQRIQTAAARLVFNLQGRQRNRPDPPPSTSQTHAPARALRVTTSAGRESKGRTAKSQLFSVLAPLWRTDLPADVRTAESETTCFRKRLKTHLFRAHLDPAEPPSSSPPPPPTNKTPPKRKQIKNFAIILCLYALALTLIFCA